jgi:hypothetical protein
MKLSLKSISYIVSIILSGVFCLLFNQIFIIRNICLLVILIVSILIYFDKEYRNKYISHIPNWLIISVIILIFLSLGYSFLI